MLWKSKEELKYPLKSKSVERRSNKSSIKSNVSSITRLSKRSKKKL